MKILLKNGKVIIKKINVRNSEGSKSKAFARFNMSLAEGILLSKYIITDFKLGDITITVPTEEAKKS